MIVTHDWKVPSHVLEHRTLPGCTSTRLVCSELDAIGSELARAFFTFAALVGAAMCSAFRCGSHDRWP